jgi:hypothetical protein
MQWHSIDAWHVADWLITAVADGQPWVTNVDDNGYPKKLMKCGSLDRLVHEATKGLRQRNIRDSVLSCDDESFVFALGAGHTLVRLLSRAALRKEGLVMHHCIGRGAYDDLLDDPEIGFFSVRNMDGKPLATLEVRDGYVRQFRGPANATPAVKELVAPALDAFGWQDWRDRPRPTQEQDYGPEAAVILRDLPPGRRRP